VLDGPDASGPLGPEAPARRHLWRAVLWSAGELLDGGRGDGREEVDEVAVGVTKQQRPVAPGHRGGLADEFVDEAGQVLVHSVHVGLADRLGVDARTVRRYIGHLIDLDVPVESVRGRYGGYRLASGYRMPPLMFSDDEAVAVLLGLLESLAFTTEPGPYPAPAAGVLLTIADLSASGTPPPTAGAVSAPCTPTGRSPTPAGGMSPASFPTPARTASSGWTASRTYGPCPARSHRPPGWIRPSGCSPDSPQPHTGTR